MRSVLIPANVRDLPIAHPEITGDTVHVSQTILVIHTELLAIQVSSTKLGSTKLKLQFVVLFPSP